MLSWSFTVEGLAPGETRESAEVLAVKDYAIDQTTGDIEIPFRLVSGVDAIAQRLVIRLRFFKGEWFLDQREGVPYLERIFVRNPQLPVIESIFRRVIQETPGVVRVVSYDHALASDRTYTATVRVQIGASLVRLAAAPFIVGSNG